MSRSIRHGLTALTCLLWAALAQAQFDVRLDEMLAEPMPHVPKALGGFTHPVSTGVPAAQAFFDQGFQLMYGYGKYEAIRSFRAAQAADPDCAMCYWGEAWSWGSYLNQHLPENEAPYAYAAIQKALTLRDGATPREQAYIDALATRYVTDYDFDTRRVQDEAYAQAMQAVVEAYPDDLDAATLHADALFLLEPRRGYRDIDRPEIRRIRELLEGILARDIHHVGACHLYIHLTESTERPELAEPCAEFIGDAVPGASHLNHMPSHTWNEIGRWGDSVRANIQAWHSDLKAAVDEGVAIYPPHNLQMLFYSGSYDGQGAIAMRAAKDYTKLVGNNGQESMVLVRFGRFEDLLDVGPQPASDFEAGAWDFGQGYAKLKLGDADFARAHLARLSRLAETTEAEVRFDPASRLLGVLAEILRGEIEWADGNLNAAIEAFERAVDHEDRLTYDEPEALPFAARHWLGAALLEAGRERAAERAYREELADHPHNGWSLFGLKAALAAQGETDADVDADFASSWARSDVWITASKF